MLRTMRAAILHRLHEPLILDEVGLPKKLDYGQVFVKVHYSGVCGSQLGEIDGAKGHDKYLPHLLGHEASGEVLEVGPGVRHAQAGDHVVLHWRKGVGIDAVPPVYKWRGKRLNAGFVTTFNEYAVVSENRLTPVPRDFDLRIAPLLGCAVITGLGVVTNNAKLKIGESIVVFGVGGVGLSVIQGAVMSSAHPVVAVDIHDSRLRMAGAFGATHLINSAQTDPRAEIQKIFGVGGADVTIDNTGNTSVISLAYELAQPRGRVVLVGVPKAGDLTTIHTLPLHFGKVVTGSHGGESDPSVDIPKYVRLHEAGKLDLDLLITDTFPLDGINKAIDKMRKGETAGRCIIEM